MSREYDFTSIVDRSKDNSNKWELMKVWNPQVEEGIVPFSVADLDMKIAPEIVEGLQDYIGNTVLGYTIVGPEYKQAIMDWNKNRHDWLVEEDWILTSSGVVPALYTAIHAYTQPDQAVAIMTPVYHPFKMAIQNTKRQVVEVPLEEDFPTYQINFSALEKALQRPDVSLLFLCSPHNPVGRVWTKEELSTISHLAFDNDVVVVADEIHYDIIFPGYQHTVFAALSDQARDNCIVCTAPSKSFNIAGLQASTILIPNPDLRQKFRDAQVCSGFECINMLGAKATELAYTKAGKWLEELVELSVHNHQVLKDYLGQHFPQVKVYDIQGTYLQWLDFRPLGIPAKELENLLHKEAQVFLNEGYIFGANGEGFGRMNIACPTEVLVAALERMVEVLSKV